MNPTEIKAKFAESIKSRRAKLCLTQEQLAERANLHRTYISDIERGGRNLSLENISKLAVALETSISNLFPSLPVLSGLGSGRDTVVLPENQVEILLVEDYQDDVELTLHAFKDARFNNRVHVVRDGREALDYVFCQGTYSHRRSRKLPEVILLDLALPKVSGLEVLRRLKAHKKTSSIRVIILTISKNDRDIAECRRLGVDAYIVKPVTFQNLSKATPLLNLNWTLVKPQDPETQSLPRPNLDKEFLLHSG